MIQINDEGVLRRIKQIHVNDQGTLREIDKSDFHDGGLLRRVFDKSLPVYWTLDSEDDGAVPTTAYPTLGDERTTEATIITNQAVEFVFDLTGTVIVFDEIIDANTIVFTFASGDPLITSDSFTLYINGNPVTVTMGNEEEDDDEE